MLSHLATSFSVVGGFGSEFDCCSCVSVIFSNGSNSLSRLAISLC